MYGITSARVAFDRKLTTFQSLHNLFKFFREVTGSDVLLNACIGEPGRYALGLVDAARIGGDIDTKWQTVKDNLMNLLLFASTNGVWWQGDPDVFYMRRENSLLSPDENFVLTGTLGLIGGLFLTSDFPSQWTTQARSLVQEFWNDQGPQAPVDQRIVVSADGIMKAYRVSYRDSHPIRHRVALYNWSDTPQTLRVNLAVEARIAESREWRIASKQYSQDVALVAGVLVSKSQPGHSLRIADLML